MQSPSENTNTSWSRDEVAQLIEYAQHLQKENEDMKANVIAMNAKLSNEEAKVRQLSLLIKQLTTPYEERN